MTLASIAQDRLGSMNGKFYPYGQERPSATTNDKEKFTGYFRDSATGLEYADQRYHNPGQGRFMTADAAPRATTADPSSWNRYAYTRSDPVNRVDPTGSFDISTYDLSGSWFAPDWADPGLIAGGSPIGSSSTVGVGGCMAIGFLEGSSGCLNPDDVYSCSANGLALVSSNWTYWCEGPYNPIYYGPDQQKPKDPECFAQLKYRPVAIDVSNSNINEIGFATHAYWWIQDRTGNQFIIHGGPQDEGGGNQSLRVWIDSVGNAGPDTISASTWWDSGLASSNCDGIDRMLATARGFAARNWWSVTYDPVFGPNSNSAARAIGQAGGFFPSPPVGAFGWFTNPGFGGRSTIQADF